MNKPPNLTQVPETPAVTEENRSGVRTRAVGGRRRTQMADIARLAGVSTSTVSRALSSSPLIPPATRERIVELARSLNYSVNVGAANLRKQDVSTVAVVLLSDSMQAVSDPFMLSLLGAIADELNLRGMSVLLTRLGVDDPPEKLSALVDSGQAAGLLVLGQLDWHDHLNRLVVRGVPLVVWGAVLPDALYPVVGGDNERGGYLATQHLIEQGCRHIAFFGHTIYPETRLRYQGYRRALAEAGVPHHPELEQPFLFGDSKIRHVLDDWMQHGTPFDAVFANSDVTALSIVSALSERGVRVPAQVRVVGYDDIVLAAHLHPSLSTVRQPTLQAGQALVELLYESFAGQPRRSLTLNTQLVVRDSSL